MALAAGTRLGPYEIVSPLAAGGMGEVYRVRDTRLDRVVAIKVLPAQLATDLQFRERFEREAQGKEAIVWIYELAGTSAMRRLTFGGNNRFPMWSADGQRVAFQSDREGDLAIWQRADGSGAAERLKTPEPKTSHIPEAWSPNGDTLMFSVTKETEVSP
jgi:dipeptidyl aminopeptidase/acylaminoacyl peptidase